jgi:hypothetical protein
MKFPLFLLSVLLIWSLPSCRFFRMAVIQMPGQHDFKLQESSTVRKGNEPIFYFNQKSETDQKQFLANVRRFNHKPGDTASLEKILSKNSVAAFLMIRQDTIIAERYLNGYPSDRYFTSFSVAKSFTSTLLGFALDEGLISGLDAQVIQYILFH